MERAFRWASLIVAIVLAGTFVPVVANLLSGSGWAAAAPWNDRIIAFLGSVPQASWWTWAIGLSIGLTAGAWAGWLLRKPLLSVSNPAALADDMADMLQCMRLVSEACHSSSYQEGEMVLAYTRFQALQMTLQTTGLRVPWRHWDPGDDPLSYLQASMGFLALVEPLVRQGHLTTAIRVSQRSLGLGGSPRGPLMRIGGALKRVA